MSWTKLANSLGISWLTIPASSGASTTTNSFLLIDGGSFLLIDGGSKLIIGQTTTNSSTWASQSTSSGIDWNKLT